VFTAAFEPVKKQIEAVQKSARTLLAVVDIAAMDRIANATR
jgi:hypothetical protein